MYLAADHLGSTRMMTGPQSTAYHDYLPFGEEIPSGAGGRGILYGETDDPRQKFTGKERDAETGLDWFGTRYLSSAQGRFTSPDKPFADQHPEDPQSWNLYGYVRNNPLRMVDDDGEGAKEVLSGIWQGAKNAYNGTMAGFIGLATQTDKAVAGTWSDFKEGVQLLSSSEGRQSIAEGWSSLSDQDKAAFVTEVAIGVVATVASHGE
jgi:RHS repeat-associated protein